jgi:dTDP-4-amino-4,6-dideoxygalactose transaminase
MTTAVRTVPFGRPWITDEDRAAVAAVLDGHVLTHGPKCKEFEAAFAAFVGDGAHCVTVSSCMAALHLAYLHLGIGPGDEVMVPAQTHVATAHAVEWVGAHPVFVDCDPATGNVTADRLAAKVGPRTKAIAVVHYLGIPCAMPEIVRLAERHGLKVIEDCALAVGSRYEGRHAGLFGDAGCFSFYPVKHLTTGEGGMFLSRHVAVAEAVARLRAFGVDRTHTERAIPGQYDVPTLGLNYRMGEMQAALGCSQLRRMPENLRHRRDNFRRLKQVVARCEHVHVLDVAEGEAASSHYCLGLVLRGPLAGRRNEIVARLNAAGVGTSIYYPQPVPRMAYYRGKYGYDPAAYPNAAALSDQGIALPVGPHLTGEDVAHVADTFTRTILEG